MKIPSSLLFASSVLTVALGLPALAVIHAQGSVPGSCGGTACVAALGDEDRILPVIRVSGDDDDDEGSGWFRRGHDDDDDSRWARRGHDDDDDEGECDDDDDDCTGARGNPAPAGTVAPPANGLFGNGAPPVAVTN